jgi:hypothetical protein
MSFTRKLQITIGMVFILATANAASVTAQTPARADTLRTTVTTHAESTIAAEKDSAQKLSGAGVELIAPVNNTEVKADVSNPNTMAIANSESRGAEAPAKTAKAKSPQSNPDDDEWHFQFLPYFWLAGLHGTAGIGNRTTQVDESFGDVWDVLNFAFMGVFEARKGKFISLTDLEYVNVNDEKATPGPLFSNVDAKFKTFIFSPEVGYRVWNNPDSSAFVDVVGGARIWHLSTELDFGAGILPATTVEGSRNWVDAVGGVRGRAALSEKVFVNGYFDLGGGGSKFTYQLYGGGGYNLNKRVALLFGYRVLDVNYDKDNFIYDMNQRGPIMGVGFKF